MPLLGLWIGRGAAEDQTRQCRNRLGKGAVASFATTWLTLHAQERAQRFARTMSRRDHLYGDLLEEASRLFSDALILEFDEPSKFVRLWALIERLRLFVSAKVRQPLKFPGVWLPFRGVRR
jgi:hypothetical protein